MFRATCRIPKTSIYIMKIHEVNLLAFAASFLGLSLFVLAPADDGHYRPLTEIYIHGVVGSELFGKLLACRIVLE